MERPESKPVPARVRRKLLTNLFTEHVKFGLGGLGRHTRRESTDADEKRVESLSLERRLHMRQRHPQVGPLLAECLRRPEASGQDAHDGERTPVQVEDPGQRSPYRRPIAVATAHG